MKDNLKKCLLGIATVGAMLLFCSSASVSANEYGTDTSRYQGNTVVKGRSDDKFNIAQVGGYTNGYYYNQSTYKSQVASGIAQGLYEHTYIWMEGGASSTRTVNIVNHFLPQIQTPKGSVIALDVEHGYNGYYKQANTNAIKAGMRRIKQAGYTPVLYTGKSYINSVAYPSQIVKEFPTSLWLAQYPTMQVTQHPNYNYAPVMNGYNTWQYSSMGRAQGLDMNVAFNKVWHSGYDGKHKVSGGTVAKPNTKPQAVKDGLNANKAKKKNIKVGDMVKVNFSASHWSNGASIPSWVKGKSYKVIQVSGNKVLLGGIMSWLNKSDAEILIKTNQSSHPAKQATSYYTVRYGDNLGSIAARYHTTTTKLARLNGISNINYIREGQRLKVAGGASNSRTSNAGRYRIVQPNDSLSRISYLTGYSINYLAQKNGIVNKNYLQIGQKIYY